MSNHEDYSVSITHMQAFGVIIQWFARHEYLMHLVAAALLKADLGAITMLMTGLGYAGKRDAINSLLTYVAIKAEVAAKIKQFLDDLHSYNRLRNSIAHNTWVEGSRPNAIKPLYVVVRGGSGRIVGMEESEQDYTPQELLDKANKIGALYNNFRDYLESIGLLSIIEQNIEIKRM